jgi:HK97 family phage prohead protease
MRAVSFRATSKEEFALVGRAISYGLISSNEVAPGVRERILAGAFTKSLKSADVKALFNHNPDLILGRTKAGTLTLTDSDAGLDFRIQLDKSNSRHGDLYSSVKRGDISECSFAFQCEEQEFVSNKYNGAACTVRNVKRAQIIDVSVVTYPFYGEGATNVDARKKPPVAKPAAPKYTPKASQADADKSRRALADLYGKKIAADAERDRKENELRERMKAARGF